MHVRKFYLESFQEQIHLKREKYVSKIHVSVLIIMTSASTFGKKKGAIIILMSQKGNYRWHRSHHNLN